MRFRQNLTDASGEKARREALSIRFSELLEYFFESPNSSVVYAPSGFLVMTGVDLPDIKIATVLS